jgi:transcriptional regulator with XRE-family HTH domain
MLAAAPILYNAQLIAEDMALKGWLQKDLARQAHCTQMTVGRFLKGQFQSNKTAKKLADALGYPLSRYLISQATHYPAAIAS